MATSSRKPKARKAKIPKMRYAEYYDQQEIMDELYDKSLKGEIFGNLMPLITSKANIFRVYRSMKSNKGSMTEGTDGLTISDIECLEPEVVVSEIRRRLGNYRPKAVRRKEIPKPNGKTRPLGIPCIWDRLIQQCVLQILEPICEAKFSDNSYGFRPLRSVEHAIAAEMKLVNESKLHFVVEVDIKGFFDEVNHAKLMRQLWALGIRDKKLLAIIKAILKAPIRMPDGTICWPQKGTPQGGILSPLLANIVLNELDQWVDSQWKNNPVVDKYAYVYTPKKGNARVVKSNGYTAMKKTNLKEMRIIRYADDVRILCRTRRQANLTAIAVKQWLAERLKLQVSEEKTRVVNLEKGWSEFLGFKMTLREKGKKRVAKTHMCDKAKKRIIDELKEQIKRIQHSQDGKMPQEISKYNAMVRGIHRYYEIATHISRDAAEIKWATLKTLKRLKPLMNKSGTIGKRSQDNKRYGKSKQLRFIRGQWILPIGYVKTRNAMHRKGTSNIYTVEGRKEVHENLAITNIWIALYMAQNPIPGRSVEYNDNRVSLFAAQWGKCAITGREFLSPDEVHCHHKTPRKMGGGDEFSNLILVLKELHILIHATRPETISAYLSVLKLNQTQMKKLNELREKAGCEPV